MTGDIFFKTVSHFFPKLTRWLEAVEDPRDENKIIYKPSHLLWLGIFLFLLRLGSKRKISYKLSTEEFLKNLNQLAAGYSENVAHHDTVEYFLGKLEPEEISKIRHKIIARLIRMKCLAPFRLLDLYYMIAIDGACDIQRKALSLLSYQRKRRQSLSSFTSIEPLRQHH